MKWQCQVAVCQDAIARASDHLAIEIRFQLRNRKRRKVKNDKNDPLPEWLFHDQRFLHEWKESVQSWTRQRADGFQALAEYIDLTKTMRKEFLRHHRVLAKTVEYQFDMAMSMHMDAQYQTLLSIEKVSKRFAAYPELRDS